MSIKCKDCLHLTEIKNVMGKVYLCDLVDLSLFESVSPTYKEENYDCEVLLARIDEHIFKMENELHKFKTKILDIRQFQKENK